MAVQFEGVVAIPTRGAVLTDVMQGVVQNMVNRMVCSGKFWTMRTTTKDPIPDAQNNVTRESLLVNPDMIWYVEEDTVPAPGVLGNMIRMCTDVVVADYNLEKGEKAVHYRDGKLLFGGLGCMLIRRRVLELIGDPWFSVKAYTIVPDGTFAKQGFTPKYGGQDISLFAKLQKLGIKAQCVTESYRCKHLRIDKLGERGTNNGLHTIREL